MHALKSFAKDVAGVCKKWHFEGKKLYISSKKFTAVGTALFISDQQITDTLVCTPRKQ